MKRKKIERKKWWRKQVLPSDLINQLLLLLQMASGKTLLLIKQARVKLTMMQPIDRGVNSKKKKEKNMLANGPDV